MIGLAPVDVADVGAMMTLLMRCSCTIWNVICPPGVVIVSILHQVLVVLLVSRKGFHLF